MRPPRGAPGGAPVMLRTLNVDEWPDTGALVVAVPGGIAGVAGQLVDDRVHRRPAIAGLDLERHVVEGEGAAEPYAGTAYAEGHDVGAS